MKQKGTTAEREYRVTWETDITATSFRQAAERALTIQRRPGSIAAVFDVRCRATGAAWRVDLLDDDNPEATLRCRVCGDLVAASRLRDHLCEHNPNADNLEPADVWAQFEERDSS